MLNTSYKDLGRLKCGSLDWLLGEQVSTTGPQLDFFILVPSRIYLIKSTFLPTTCFHTLVCDDLGPGKKGRFHC